MNVAILGAGFGLYGYLPALSELPCRILLPERYRAVVQGRTELSGLAAGVDWVADDKEAVRLAEAVIVARRPEDQVGLVAELLAKPRVTRLLIEKPVAPNPDAAARLQGKLEASNKIVRIGYTLGFTGWGRDLCARAAAPDDEIGIRWAFRAHHYANDRANWKRSHAQGGGALRFYGVQLISLLAALGFDRVDSSMVAASRPDEVESWRATLSDASGARCDLDLDSNATRSEFSVRIPKRSLEVSLPDPFDQVPGGGRDRRVPVLSLLCKELLTAEGSPHRWYQDTISLWQAIEQATFPR